MTTDEVIALTRERIHSERGGIQHLGPPATVESWQMTEKAIGHALPPMLRELYTKVANGGFGPGYGLRGALGGAKDDNNWDLVDYYRLQQEIDPETPTWIWPDGLVALNDWGCAIASCVDCSDPMFPMIGFDPNGLDVDDPASWQASFVAEGMNFDAWISAWASGANLHQPQRRG